MQAQDLAGGVALITGATQGIGEATARLLVQRGAGGLVISGRQAERGHQLAADLSSPACPVLFVPAELEAIDACRGIVAAAEAAFGRLHFVVNCAGITSRGGLDDTTPELWDRIFNVNVRAPFFIVQAALPLLRRSVGERGVVNILSMSSHGGQTYLSPYSASKGALATLTRNMAYSLLADRIRVNGLNIGWTDTPNEHLVQTRVLHRPDTWLADAEARQPFGRLLKPLDVARVIAFLCSGESGLMTGSIIDCDQVVMGCSGGWMRP